VIEPPPILDCGSAERPRVLLADDHPARLVLTSTTLPSEFFVVGSVGNGCELMARRLRSNIGGAQKPIPTHEINQ